MKKLIRKLTENDRTTVKDEVILIIFTLLLIICSAAFFLLSHRLGKELYAAFFTAGVMTALASVFFVIILIYRLIDNLKHK